ncbi:MAG TPA: hypothetical protein VEW46_23270 [Pyrinomonadaceae bacterium]|nr:hypothetical protein [Pyrinomonadaceae bacterium]
MDHLNDTLHEAERDEIEKLVIKNFPGLDVKHRDAAKFCRVRLQSGRECHVKVFKPTHNRLYAIENHALRSLSWTGRVCPVLYSSPNLDGSDRAELNGYYFLVKPHFKKFLDQGGKLSRLLDDAAQLVSLAQRLKEQGWYDFDENWENEAFTEEGRLIRFDMDAAFPCNLLSSKFNAVFHAPPAFEVNRELNNICEKLVREDHVLVSLAVKICRFLLNRPGDFPELTQQLSSTESVAAVHNGKGSRAKYVNWLATSVATFVKSLRNVSGVASRQITSINPPADAERTGGLGKQDASEAVWLKLWETRLGPNRDAQSIPLTIAESRFLGLLFSHILQNKAVGWKLTDFYHSLLLLLAGKLQNLAAKYSNSPQFFSALVEELYEFKHLALAPPPGQIEPVTEAKPDKAVTVLKIEMEKVQLEGNSWITTKKQGAGCQDLVLKFKEAPFPFFVIADGVSNANGGEAIKILQKQCNQIFNEMTQKPDAREPKQWIAELIRRTNDALLIGRAQTTAVIVMLCDQPAASVVLAQFGDSPWVFIKEDAAGGSPRAQKNPRFCDEKVLGKARINSEEWITDEILQQSLEAGSYHIRAYSDGIPESLHSILMNPGPIGELVKEVSKWGIQRPTEVGHDDWSVAGVDFTVQEDAIEIIKPKMITEVPALGFFNWMDACANIPHSLFQLSQPAREFWQRALTDERCRELAEYSVIKEAGLVTEVATKQIKQTTTSDTPSTEASGNYKQLIPASHILPAMRTSIVVVVIVFAIYWVLTNSGNRNDGANNNNNTSASEPARTPTPSFNDLDQRSLFTTLYNGNDIAFGPLAANNEVDSRPLNRLISDLAVVLSKTSWKVSIEIHTSLTGTKDGNLTTAKNIGSKLLAELKERGIPEARIKLEPKGKQNPLFPRPRDNKEAEQNRRIVIRRLD